MQKPALFTPVFGGACRRVKSAKRNAIMKILEKIKSSAAKGGRAPGGNGNGGGGHDLAWIDEFIANVRPYVFVRLEDNLLIKRPNRAQKLNAQGARILKALLDGMGLEQLLERTGREPEKVRDIALFMEEVKRFLENRQDEFSPTAALEVQPFEMQFSQLPILSEIALTYRCNLKCRFCYAGCNCTTNPAGSDREMSAPEIKTVLEKIFRQAKVPSVSFTGGEPTLHRHLPALIAYAKQLGMRVNLITNGTRITPELAQRLSEAGLDSAQVSIEGVSAEVHDRVTAVRGSFAKTVAGARHLKAAGIYTHTNTTINRLNLAGCPEIPRFVKETFGNERFSMNLIIPTGSAALNRELAVRYEELAPHLEAISEASRREGVEFMWYSPTPLCMFNPIVHGFGNKGCSACDGLLSVAANGDLLPCASYDESVGSLLEEDFPAIWQSQRAKQFREKFWAYPACRGCEHFALCHGACPLYWRQMGFDELRRRNGFAPGEK